MAFRIKELRKQRGWTQEHLAALIGRTKGHVSEMESGKKNPSSPLMDKMAEVFGVSVTDLFMQDPAADPDLAGLYARIDRLSEEGRKKLTDYAELLELQQRQASE